MCSKCKRTFKTYLGLEQYQKSCEEKQVPQSNLTVLYSKSISLNTDTCDNIWNKNRLCFKMRLYIGKKYQKCFFNEQEQHILMNNNVSEDGFPLLITKIQHQKSWEISLARSQNGLNLHTKVL